MIKKVFRRTSHKTQVGVVTEGENVRTTSHDILRKSSTWRPQGSWRGQAPPLPYTTFGDRSVYGRGDPCGRPGGGVRSRSSCKIWAPIYLPIWRILNCPAISFPPLDGFHFAVYIVIIKLITKRNNEYYFLRVSNEHPVMLQRVLWQVVEPEDVKRYTPHFDFLEQRISDQQHEED